MSLQPSAHDLPPDPLARAAHYNEPELVSWVFNNFCTCVNTETGPYSALHIALQNRLLFQMEIEEGRRFSEAKALKIYWQEADTTSGRMPVFQFLYVDHLRERKKAEAIVWQLMMQGARLDHAPAGGHMPLTDSTLWHDPTYSQSVMLGALYCAIRRREAPPRPMPAAIFADAHAKVKDTFAGNACARASLESQAKLRFNIASKLAHPDTPLEQAVARELPLEEKDYWLGSNFKRWLTTAKTLEKRL